MNNNERYQKLNKKPPKFNKQIKAFIPTPKEDDYKRGYLQRYFIQKSNDKSAPIFEVKSTDVSLYRKNPYYSTGTLKWRISGPKETQYDNVGNIKDKGVLESNRISISLLKNEIPNLKFYLPNLIQFYKM